MRSQLGNVYDLRGVAVRSPSVIERIQDSAPAGPTEVTAIMDVNRDFPDDFYQPTTREPVEEFDGRWYLGEDPALRAPDTGQEGLGRSDGHDLGVAGGLDSAAAELDADGVPSKPKCPRSVLSR